MFEVSVKRVHAHGGIKRLRLVRNGLKQYVREIRNLFSDKELVDF